MAWILLILSAIAMLVVIFVAFGKTVNETEEGIGTSPISNRGKGIGAPLFLNTDGRKETVQTLAAGQQVWALTPHGPQLVAVTRAGEDEAVLANDAVTVEAYLDRNYFSGLASARPVWRVALVRGNTGAIRFYTAESQRQNRMWIRDESIWGDDDLLDWIIMYHFMFDGFPETQSYYESYETPIYEDLPFPEPVAEQPAPEPEPEPVAEQPAPEPEPEPVAEQPAPEPEPEPVIEEPPAPEPEVGPSTNFDFEETRRETYSPPPAPDPEPYSPPSDDGGGWGSSDSGGGFDSGGSDDW